MKLNITITRKGKGSRSDETITEIKIINGVWEYLDDYMETTEKTRLTLNNINTAHYLHLPVKDTFPRQTVDENDEVQVTGASVRTYETLLQYLNHRIANVTESYEDGTYKLLHYDEDGGMSWHILIFNEQRHAPNDVCADIIYEKESLCEVKISVVE